MIFNYLKRVAFISFAVLLSFQWTQGLAYEYSGKKILSMSVISDNPSVKKSAQELFGEFVSLPLSYEKIAKAIRVLQKRGDVEKVSVDVSEDDKRGVKLTVSVRLKLRVEEIVIEGNMSYSSLKLKGVLGIEEGALVSKNELDEALARLKDFYVARGFLKAEFSYERIYFDSKDRGGINIKIIEGEPCLIREIKFSGNLMGKSAEELTKKLGIKAGSVLNRINIGKRAAGLERRLAKRGYLLSKINSPLVDYDAKTNTALLVFAVDVGPKIEVLFRGNHYFFERSPRLKEIIRLKEEKQFSPTWVESAKFELERFYKRRGYAFVEIEYDDVVSSDGTERKITFRIKKNNKVVIKGIEFSGNREFSDSFLKNKLYSFDISSVRKKYYVKEDFRKALKSLIGFYRSKGFLKAEIISEPSVEFDKRRKRARIRVSVSEGSQFLTGDIEILGNTFKSKEYLKEFILIKANEPYNPFSLRDSIDKLSKFYMDHGFKFVRIYSQENINERNVDVLMLISEGERVTIGDISIEGNVTTDEKIIRGELQVSGGGYYSPSKIERSEENVSRLGVFSSVTIKEKSYDPASGKLDVSLFVKEKKKRSLRTRIGYGSDEGLRGALDLTFINIGGKGRSLSLGGQLSHRLKSSNILRRKEVVSYREPRLFGSKLAGKISVIDEREEEPQFNIDRTALAMGVDASISKSFRSSVTYNIEYRKPFALKIAEDELSEFDESRKRLAYMQVAFDYDKRDNIFNPTKGFLKRVTFDVYNRSLWSEHNFLQVYLSNNLYWPVFKKIRFALAIKCGFSSTYGSTSDQGIPIPIEKRFRLGGSYSLRGFPLNSVGGLDPDEPAITGESVNDQAPGGNSIFNYNLELIFPLLFNFDFVLFTDGGEAYKTNKDFNPLDIRNSAGFGLRYNTPIGPLRLDVGFILDKRSGEEWGAIQFAVGLL